MLEIDKNSREIAFSDDFRHIGSRKSGCFCKLIQQQQYGRDLIMFPNCEAQVPNTKSRTQLDYVFWLLKKALQLHILLSKNFLLDLKFS